MITSILPSCIAAACMLLVWLLPSTESLWLNIVYVGIAGVIYLAIMMIFPEERKIIIDLPKLIKK